MVCNHKSLNTTLFGSATIIRYVEYTSLIARIKLVTLNSESYNLDILKEFFYYCLYYSNFGLFASVGIYSQFRC